MPASLRLARGHLCALLPCTSAQRGLARQAAGNPLAWSSCSPSAAVLGFTSDVLVCSRMPVALISWHVATASQAPTDALQCTMLLALALACHNTLTPTAPCGHSIAAPFVQPRCHVPGCYRLNPTPRAASRLSPPLGQNSPHSLPPLQLCCHGLRGHTRHRPAAPLLRQVPARGCSSQSRPCTHAAVDDSAGGTHHAAAVRWVGRHYHGAVGSTGVGSARS